MQSSDIAIIGAGPIGLELAVALKRANINYLHFDAHQIGYTISWFASQTRFFSSNERIAIAGVPLMTPDQLKATREQYLTYLRSVVLQFDLRINTYEPVINIQRRAGHFLLTTSARGSERQYEVNKIILATGGTATPRFLNVPGEDLPHVSHYFQDPHTYFRKRVLIVGGKNSAVEAALRCHHAGANVSLSYRREQLNTRSIKYWLLPEITGLAQSEKIKTYYQTVPSAITRAHVTLRRDNGSTFDVETDFVLLLVGYVADMSLFKLAGCDLTSDSQSPVLNGQTMETTVPGIYAAGTAIGGTQDKYTLFIENCHVHVQKILGSITGQPTLPDGIAEVTYAQQES